MVAGVLLPPGSSGGEDRRVHHFPGRADGCVRHWFAWPRHKTIIANPKFRNQVFQYLFACLCLL